jgi:hypothetical protein
MIADEGLDIVAFQEVSEVYGKDEIDVICRNLPSWWKGDYVSGSEFAFIWNSERVEMHSTTSFPEERMARKPLYGRFSPKGLGPNSEFRLIDIHIVHGGDDNQIHIALRKAECNLVKGEIYRTVDVSRYGDSYGTFTVFTVVLGDYNLDCDECNSCGPRDVQTFQEEKTTLKMTEGYYNSYDHFSFNVAKNSSIPYTVSRIEAINRYFNGDFTRYRENVSDHAPVKLKIF